jgi:hypothetical protein
MKPAWDRLMIKYKDHPTILVADVDCTADGKSLCFEKGVNGYPTIKSGSPDNLEDYSGDRDFESLEKHASRLKPVCSIAKKELCSEEQRAELDALLAMDNADLESFIKKQDDARAEAERVFKAGVDRLQETFKQLSATKEATLEKIKESGVGQYKAVLAHKKLAAEIAAGSPDAIAARKAKKAEL